MQLWCHCSGWRCFHSNSCWGSWVLEFFLHSWSIGFFPSVSRLLIINQNITWLFRFRTTDQEAVSRAHTSATVQQSSSVLTHREHSPSCTRWFYPNSGKKQYKMVGKSCLTMSPYVAQHQKLMRSSLGQDPSSIQVFWRSDHYFFWNPADKPNKQQNNQPAGDIWPQQTPDWQHLNASPVDCRAASQFSPETRFRTQNQGPAVHSRLYRVRTCLWGGDGEQTDCFKSGSICVSALTLMKKWSALIIDQYQQSVLQLIFIYVWISVWLNIWFWLAAGCLLISSSSSRYHRVVL